MTLLPEREAAPIEPPPNAGDEYGLTPLPKSWSEISRPDDGTVSRETYALGEEVTEVPFHPEAKTWREIVASAGQSHAADASGDESQYGLGPQSMIIERRRQWSDYAAEVAAKMRGQDDDRIGRLSDPRRFTLTRLLFVMTLASIVLAVGARFPRQEFAGVVGVVALFTALCSRWLMGSSALAQLAWWTLMAIYVIAGGFSLLNL